MTLIGVISDTHGKKIPSQVLRDFEKFDIVVHAGDICSIVDIENLKKISELKAVAGNMDSLEIQKILPKKQIFKVEDVRIGLFHGEGSPKKCIEIVKEEFKNDKVEIVIFGHTHQPYFEEENGILYFNPGSPNDKIFAPYCSYGILKIDKNKIDYKIIKVEI